MLVILLREHHCEAIAAISGGEALSIAPSFLPDIVLLDIGLPGMSGFETARRLRAIPCGKTVRIIALTAWDDDDTRRMVAMAGMERHLIKPACVDVILAAIHYPG